MSADDSPKALRASITRRSAVGAMAACGIGYAFFGPRGTRGGAAARSAVVLDYWEKWTGHEGQAMLEIVEAFNRSQERIRVRCFAMANIDRKSMVAIAGGTPPDVLGLWNYNIPAYAESGAILPLDALQARHGLGPAHYADSIWPLMLHEGTRYAAVNTCGTTALYYDRAACREAGLDVQHPPRTIGELDAWAERLTVVDRAGAIRRAGFLHSDPGWWSWAWGSYFGGALYDAAAGRATTASSQNVRAYEWVQSYPRRYGFERLERLRSTFGAYMSMQQSFLTGRVAMIMQGPWLANLIDSFAPDLDYAAAPFPVHESIADPDRPVGSLEADVLVVPRGAAHPEEAIEFIAFTQRRENVERLSRAHAKPSPLRTVSREFAATHPNRAVDVHERVLRSPGAFIVPPLRTWPHYRDELVSGMERIWSLAAPAGEVLRTVQERAQAEIERAARRRRERARR